MPIYIVTNLDRSVVSWADSFIESLSHHNVKFINSGDIKNHNGDDILLIGDDIPQEICLYDNRYVYFLAAADMTQLERRNIMMTQACIVPSTTEKRKISAAWPELAEKIYVMGFPINSQKIEAVNRLQNKYGRKHILFIGRGDIDKGIELEIQIARMLREQKYTIVHIANTKLKFKTEMQDAGIYIIEEASKEEYLKIIKEAICVINTSPQESLFVAGIEAEMLGIPVLYLESKYNAIREYSEHMYRDQQTAIHIISGLSSKDYYVRNLPYYDAGHYAERLRVLFNQLEHHGTNTAVVLSPHSDDAVISLGGWMEIYDRKYIFNFFSISGSSICEDQPGILETTRIRQKEDLEYAQQFQAVIRECGFRDCEVRGIAWNSGICEDIELQESLKKYITEEVGTLLQRRIVYDTNIDVFIPLAIGLHPDHYILLKAFLTSDICLHPKIHYYLYAEQPYYNAFCADGLLLHRLYSRCNRAAYQFDRYRKEIMLRCYPSQLSESRIQELLTEGAEYIWRIPSRRVAETLQDVVFHHYVIESFFCKDDFLTAVEQNFRSGQTEFFDIYLIRNHVKITIPLVIFDIWIGERQYRTVRWRGCFAGDYFDISNAAYLRYEDMDYIMAALKAKCGKYILWFSNVKEYSPLYYLFKGADMKIYQEISSWQIICSPKGVAAWLKNQAYPIRKYYNRSIKYWNSLCHCVKSPKRIIKPAHEKELDTLLRLQEKRASEKEGFDAFLHNPNFVAFLKTCCQRDLFSVLELWADDQVIASLLLNLDTANMVISVYMQGFDSIYKDFAPSRILFCYLIDYAHEEGYQYIDLLRGDEPYKKNLCNAQIQLFKFIKDMGYGLSEKDLQYLFKYEE